MHFVKTATHHVCSNSDRFSAPVETIKAILCIQYFEMFSNKENLPSLAEIWYGIFSVFQNFLLSVTRFLFCRREVNGFTFTLPWKQSPVPSFLRDAILTLLTVEVLLAREDNNSSGKSLSPYLHGIGSAMSNS